MNILITGGAGFIGSAVARTLVRDRAANVLVVDKLTYAGNLDSRSRWRKQQQDEDLGGLY